eukprot:TRINITY_DN17718_c0_g1_i4.p1 TRINITY_DN17718_c0_g1~~TRINITY_DN17718_c0_g1_i4.p1  ORF type:complete len:379 (-),score=82.43 TRINITY_DN17718_c0_g1_i4:448-1584(-)
MLVSRHHPPTTSGSHFSEHGESEFELQAAPAARASSSTSSSSRSAQASLDEKELAKRPGSWLQLRRWLQVPALLHGGGYDGVAAAPVPDAAERRWLWRATIESAAGAEVFVNVCLPLLVCDRDAASGSFRPPSARFLCMLVLLFNFSGAFMEGFCKSARLLCQAGRRTKASQQLVFVMSHALAGGFLNVLTSFPDIAENGNDVIAATGSYTLGALFCLFHLVGGLALYRCGCLAGWQWTQRHWPDVVAVCAAVTWAFRGLLVMVVTLILWPSLSSLCGIVNEDALLEGVAVPLDVSWPDHPGVESLRLAAGTRRTSWLNAMLPAPLIGLGIGVFMSGAGAIAAAVFVEIAAGSGRQMKEMREIAKQELTYTGRKDVVY